ncbi:serine hydrolase [Synechocystis sp. PCC 7509]|uniref:serine hydrolase n=1 Tax=Synechocystis sp. PCC 7509 TaxID=927677 RepID=UPI0002AC9231|nr:serine hydrolase [Synechocystis sp. PCC 7509]
MEQPLTGKKSLLSQVTMNSARKEASKNSQTSSQDIKIPYKNENLQPIAARDALNPEIALGGQTRIETSVMNRKSRSRPVNLPPKAALNHQRANPSSPTIPATPKVDKVTPLITKKRLVKRKKSDGLLTYALRLIIFGVGTFAIAGTLLSVLNPATRINQQAQPKVNKTIVSTAKALTPLALTLNQEIMPLKAAVQQLGAKNKGLTPGAFFVDLDTKNYLDWNGSLPFAAASTIKVPVLVAFFQDVDTGKIRLDEKLTIEKKIIGGGSGGMQYQPLGTKYTALNTATQMIVVSDNTATNMLIKRMGGIKVLNERFQAWGLESTKINNLLPDLTGTNTTSPKDMGNLMSLVDRGELMTLRSRDRLLEIMRRTKTRTLLPQGLGEGAIIAHKTGDIGSMVGDVGLVDMPNGKRYIAVAMVKRPHNDSRAQELIRQISRLSYQQFTKPVATQVMPSPTPFITTIPTQGAVEAGQSPR